jgi:HAD superfamily hydrolase (TIGR01549 family)
MLMEYLRDKGLASDPWEHQVLYDVFEQHGIEYVPEQSAEQKRLYFSRFAGRVFRRLNVRVSAGAAADHAADVWKLLGPASLAVFPEVSGVLGVLRTRGYRIALVSNWQCGLGHFCVELGVGAAFDHVMASAELGCAKPNREIFEEACRRLGTAPHRVLHVGDSVTDDVQGALSAGLQALLVSRDHERPETGVPTVPSLDGLLPILP